MYRHARMILRLKDSDFRCYKLKGLGDRFDDFFITEKDSAVPIAVYRRYAPDYGDADIIFYLEDDHSEKETFREIASDLGLSFISDIKEAEEIVLFKRDGNDSISILDNGKPLYRSCVTE